MENGPNLLGWYMIYLKKMVIFPFASLQVLATRLGPDALLLRRGHHTEPNVLTGGAPLMGGGQRLGRGEIKCRGNFQGAWWHLEYVSYPYRNEGIVKVKHLSYVQSPTDHENNLPGASDREWGNDPKNSY